MANPLLSAAEAVDLRKRLAAAETARDRAELERNATTRAFIGFLAAGEITFPVWLDENGDSIGVFVDELRRRGYAVTEPVEYRTEPTDA